MLAFLLPATAEIMLLLEKPALFDSLVARKNKGKGFFTRTFALACPPVVLSLDSRVNRKMIRYLWSQIMNSYLKEPLVYWYCGMGGALV